MTASGIRNVMSCVTNSFQPAIGRSAIAQATLALHPGAACVAQPCSLLYPQLTTAQEMLWALVPARTADTTFR